MWALLEFPQLVDSQVVEATRFNPKGVLPHCGEVQEPVHEVSHISSPS